MDAPVTSTHESTPGPLPEWAAAKLAALEDQVARFDTELKRRDLKIQRLVLELAMHKRARFAATSEAMDANQRVLFDEAFEEDAAAITAEIDHYEKKPRTIYKRPGRNPLPKELERIEHRHEPESCQCGKCGRDLVKIGEDISEQLDCEPSRFFVHRHIRPQYACRGCETITAPEVPAAIIDGGLAAPGLLAWVLIHKFQDHLPLYRIEQICARSGVTIARSTLASWVGQVGFQLEPLVDRLTELLRQRDVLHADETPVQQLDPGKGKTKKAYLWVYRSNDLATGPPIVVFDYQTSRAGQHVRNFLADWKGALMVDDYAGYEALFKKDVIELGCMVHARRKFMDLWKANKHPVAEEAINRFAELYRIEAEAKDLKPEDRKLVREQHAKPRLEAMHAWMVEMRAVTAKGSPLSKALNYSLKRWPALVRYVERGDYPIDNNPVENTIRPVAVGKKNWLFTGSERAGRRAAMIQSLLGTAQLNGIEPYTWLKETLEKLPGWPQSRIDELLPIARMAESG